MDPAALSALIDATWPPEATAAAGGFTLRRGAGGGSRVSAATADSPGHAAPEGIAAAEAGMRALGQRPLFMVRAGEAALDAALAARAYALRDRVTVLALDPAALPPPEGGAAYVHWPPLAAQREIWEAGGIGPARLAVMARVSGPRTSLMARTGQRPAGTAFAACAEGTVLVHAMEVAAPCRRQGAGRQMLCAAAAWARAQGAGRLAVLVTQENAAARALYEGLGARAVAGYHYRIAPDTGPETG